MCPACDVTAWVREGQQYSGPGKVPHTEMYEAPEPLGKRTQNVKYISYTIMFPKRVNLTLLPFPDFKKCGHAAM